jgi:rubrerythrin
MEALRLTYELRARYRVFEFEAEQEGHKETARLFAALSRTENEQAASLVRGLRLRLAVPGEQMTGEPA